jgi:hypothetical protein
MSGSGRASIGSTVLQSRILRGPDPGGIAAVRQGIMAVSSRRPLDRGG